MRPPFHRYFPVKPQPLQVENFPWPTCSPNIINKNSTPSTKYCIFLKNLKIKEKKNKVEKNKKNKIYVLSSHTLLLLQHKPKKRTHQSSLPFQFPSIFFFSVPFSSSLIYFSSLAFLSEKKEINKGYAVFFTQ